MFDRIKERNKRLIMDNKNELKEEELEKVSGGHDTTLHKKKRSKSLMEL